MEIEDLRKDSSWIPAISILEEFIPKLDPAYFIGIKKIVLLDKDYRKEKKEPASARYVKIQGTKFANVELYLNHFSNLPEEAKQSRMYFAWCLLTSLAHELYHHRVRGQRRIRQPKYKQEQRNADQWAHKTICPIFSQAFPKDPYEKEWNLVVQKIREYRDNRNLQTGSS